MKATLLRTGSVPVRHHSFVPGSLSGSASPRNSLRFNACGRRHSAAARGMRRASSESDVIRSESEVPGGLSSLSGGGSLSSTAILPEEEYGDERVGGVGSLVLDEVHIDRRNYAGDLPDIKNTVEEVGFPGGGIADRSKIGAYYEEMLKSNPTNSLLLRNYGKFLHEVARDMVKAEEYYGRAILASPGDGEVLSLYGKLIWEAKRDKERANSYFEQAVRASPNDCTVLGSYAHFMWEAGEEDEDDNIERD